MKKHQLILSTALLLAALAKPALADSITISIGTPPPAAIVEAVPVAPGPEADFVWHGGHWRWIDERYVWIPGHWAHRPHPGAEWVAPVWEHSGNGYVFHQGHWNEHEEHEEKHEDHGRGHDRDHGHDHDDHHEDRH